MPFCPPASLFARVAGASGLLTKVAATKPQANNPQTGAALFDSLAPKAKAPNNTMSATNIEGTGSPGGTRCALPPFQTCTPSSTSQAARTAPIRSPPSDPGSD